MVSFQAGDKDDDRVGAWGQAGWASMALPPSGDKDLLEGSS